MPESITYDILGILSSSYVKMKFISKETRNKYIKDIISFFYDERGEEIGVIAAEDLLDFVLKEIGDDIYKKAVKDIKGIVKEKMEDLDTELDLLQED